MHRLSCKQLIISAFFFALGWVEMYAIVRNISTIFKHGSRCFLFINAYLSDLKVNISTLSEYKFKRVQDSKQ